MSSVDPPEVSGQAAATHDVADATREVAAATREAVIPSVEAVRAAAERIDTHLGVQDVLADAHEVVSAQGESNAATGRRDAALGRTDAATGLALLTKWVQRAFAMLGVVALVGVGFGGLLFHNQQTIRGIVSTLNDCTVASDPTTHPPTVHPCSDRSASSGFNFSVAIVLCQKTLPAGATRDDVVFCLVSQLAKPVTK